MSLEQHVPNFRILEFATVEEKIKFMHEAGCNAEEERMGLEQHECHERDYCICSVTALEPAEECPVHSGYKDYPPRCSECGRFIKLERKEEGK